MDLIILPLSLIIYPLFLPPLLGICYNLWWGAEFRGISQTCCNTWRRVCIVPIFFVWFWVLAFSCWGAHDCKCLSSLHLGTLLLSLLQYGVGWVLLWTYASERNFHWGIWFSSLFSYYDCFAVDILDDFPSGEHFCAAHSVCNYYYLWHSLFMGSLSIKC